MNAKYVYERSVKALQSYCIQNDVNFDKTLKEIYKWKDIGNAIENEMTILADMIITAREELLKKDCGNVLPAVKRIFRRCGKNVRQEVHTSWIDGKGRQCFCEGSYAIRLKDKYDCFPIEDKIVIFDLDRIINPLIGTCKNEIKLPTAAEVKLHIAELKTKGITENGRFYKQKYFYKFDGIDLFVNPSLLLDMIEALPDAKARYAGNSLGGIYFEAENGDGVLLPIRMPEEFKEVS